MIKGFTQRWGLTVVSHWNNDRMIIIIIRLMSRPYEKIGHYESITHFYNKLSVNN